LKRKDRKLGVENGFAGTVTAIDEEAGRIAVKLDRLGREVSISLD
jgi:hypothetical protein